MTKAEHLVWGQLRKKRVGNLRFRRQYRLGRYIVDFVCLPARLIIEVDGPQYDLTGQDDDRRTLWLEGQGFRVSRFRNEDVFANPEGIVQLIEIELLAQRPSRRAIDPSP